MADHDLSRYRIMASYVLMKDRQHPKAADLQLLSKLARLRKDYSTFLIRPVSVQFCVVT